MNKNTPDLTLNMDEKIYLAVAKNITNKLAFVYTLACLKHDPKNPNVVDVNMDATAEIHAFRDKNIANLYHDTIEQIIDFNAADDAKRILFQMNENRIEKFLQQFNINVR